MKVLNTRFQIYFEQRVKHVQNHFYEFGINDSESSVHDFRLELKKLLVFLKFLRKIYPKNNFKKQINSLEIIFLQAGEIREFHLLIKWLEKNELTDFRFNYFPNMAIEKTITDLSFQINQIKYNFVLLMNENLLFVKETNIILIDQFLVDINAKIEKIISKNVKEVQWHEIRKLIKRKIYATNWIEDGQDSKFAYYQKLQELIGNWHDTQVMIHTLSIKKNLFNKDIEMHKSYSFAIDKLNINLDSQKKKVIEYLQKK
jgi:CHAD domain-containing protein